MFTKRWKVQQFSWKHGNVPRLTHRRICQVHRIARAKLFSVFADSCVSRVERKGPSSQASAASNSCVIVYKKETHVKGIVFRAIKHKLRVINSE